MKLATISPLNNSNWQKQKILFHASLPEKRINTYCRKKQTNIVKYSLITKKERTEVGMNNTIPLHTCSYYNCSLLFLRVTKNKKEPKAALNVIF